MSEEKNGSYKGLTEARRRANKKYNDRFVEIKVRVTPEKRAICMFFSLFSHISNGLNLV